MERARELVRGAERPTALTGAGVSAESGIPTFRDADGLWRRHRVADLATAGALRRDPRTVLEWYGERRAFAASRRPNPGHLALARFFLRRGAAGGLITQNVDGLHARAARAEARSLGCDPDAAMPIELHGNIARDRCARCGARSDPERSGSSPAPPGGASPRGAIPRCGGPGCGGMLRPDVVLFGEMLDDALMTRARALAAASDLCLVVGTTAEVYPAAAIPEIVRAGGGRIVEVNTQPTVLTRAADVALRGKAGEALPALLD